MWSLSLSPRQILLLLVGGGIGGTVRQHLAPLGYHALAGETLRLLVALLPFLLVLVLACRQHADRYLEVWLLVLVRYRLRPKRYLWRSIRHFEQYLYPLTFERDAPDREEGVRLSTLTFMKRERQGSRCRPRPACSATC